MYDIEKLYQAKDIGDAIRALKEDPEAVVISGGSDVLIKVRDCLLYTSIIQEDKPCEIVTVKKRGTT